MPSFDEAVKEKERAEEHVLETSVEINKEILSMESSKFSNRNEAA